MKKEKITKKLDENRAIELQEVVDYLDGAILAAMVAVPHVTNGEMLAMLATSVLDILEKMSQSCNMKISFEELIEEFINVLKD